jgi:peptide chain release factor 1
LEVNVVSIAMHGKCLQRRFIFSKSILSQLDSIVARHAEINEKLLSSSSSLSNKELTKLSREFARLEKSVSLITSYHSLLEEINETQSLCSSSVDNASDSSGNSDSVDMEMIKYAKGELEKLFERREALEASLRRCLLPQDDADNNDVIMEIRAGTGGDEASLFAHDLFLMYTNYIASQGWTSSVLAQSMNEVNGVKEISLAVSGGENIFGKLKFESGVHRVQRIPETETNGRVHTSTASVVVLPEAEEVDVEIKMSDLRIDTYRASGPGGQHVNTTDSAVRITHIPTGLVVAMQDERSQHQNRAKAMRILRARLYERMRDAKAQEQSAARKMQIGSAARSERVRTYNFTQNRVTDHRVNVTIYDIQAVLRGERVDEFISACINANEEDQLNRVSG